MGNMNQKAKRKTTKPLGRGQGRPRVNEPKLSTTLRFDPQLIAALDVWAKENGLDRSSAIRFAVSQLVKNDAAEKGR
jgi:hypothetical protein